MTSKPLCRLCIEEVEPLINVFGEFGRDQQIQEIVLKHFNIEIKEDDLLSDKMCTICWSKLIDFHSFYYQVQKAQERITMVVIEEDKGDDVDFSDYMDPKMIISNASSVKEESLHEYRIEEDVSSPSKIVGEKDDYVETRIKILSEEHDDVTQVSLADMQQFKGSSLDSCDDINDEDSATFPPISQPQHDASISRVVSFSTSTTYYTKKKSKNKSCYEISPEIESTLEKSSLKRKKESRVRLDRKSEAKDSSEEQKIKEIELIESYYRMQCNLCHEELEKFQPLFDHYSEMHQFRGFIICCGKKFFRRSVIAEHVLWHTYPEKFTCVECGNVMPNKRSYDNHMLIHAAPDSKLYQCEQCSKRFAKKFKLEKHKLSHLKDDEKQYLCDECDKPYATDALLRAHKRVVHQHSYAHICEICARVFKSRVFFEKHQLEHQGQNLPKVQCQICDAWMKNEHTMRAHMRNHQDEGREHECDICGKKGPSRNAIAKHKRFVHLSERKFKCTLCEKAFKRAITLKEHMTVHTGEVLYTCTFCPKTFNSGANMHAHRKKAHPSEWLEDKQLKLESMKPSDGSGDKSDLFTIG